MAGAVSAPGVVTLVHFFSVSCELCKTQLPQEEHHLAHPVAVDDAHTITDRFANEFVPAHYTFDRKGKLAHKKARETALKFVEQAIDRALAE